MIIRESYQDVELYLRSSDLVEKLVAEFGEEFYNDSDYGEVTNYIQGIVSDMFDNTTVTVEKVIVCRVVDSDIDIINTAHYVINFNGNYYDYTAQAFNDSFNGLISTANIPVVQTIIHSDNQINSNLSTVKGYVLLGY